MYKNRSIAFAVLVFVVLFAVEVESQVLIDCDFTSAPSSESAGGIYTCSTGSLTLSLTGGSTMDHLTSGCFSGGCAKFFPPTSDDSYAGFGAPTISEKTEGSGYSQLNTRFLMYVGSTFPSSMTNEIKTAITKRTDGGERAWISISTAPSAGSINCAFFGTIAFRHQGSNTCGVSPCGNNTPPEPTWDSPIQYCAECYSHFQQCEDGCSPFALSDYTGQWIAIEHEVKDNGEVKIYIWTQDGQFNGAYLWTDYGHAHEISGLDKVIGYFNGGSSAGENNYFLIDNVAISTSYIGPPAGFTGQMDSTAYGHVTGVTQPTTATFVSAWSGNGTITGSGDEEVITVTGTQYMATGVLNTGVTKVTLSQNLYRSGDTTVMKWRTCATDTTCTGAWTTYSAPFDSLGYIQLRVEAP